ncbi:Peroxiredoxin [Reichenbachiella agariperforans]|uniref:thioredoxin-dependent peroxiredoxin n=1 Tax=Reichenbachiella agariperforans TaxID=156994 RepID=A0A1M6P1I6_REIAG|nr:peroxiredoxin-like family protein [Reichenbachiella agariperforans]SHK01774.1 Peroxiredoxin [Reichenbachiella agariperforans]
MKDIRTHLLLVCLIFSLSGMVVAQKESSKFKKGDQAPNFTGEDQFEKPFDLSKQLKKGPVVLMFYRGYWCPYCNKQLSQMEDSLGFISEKGGSVIAVTPEKPEYIEKTVDKTDASFKIIYDKDLQIMNTYGVAYQMEEALVGKYKKKYDLDMVEINGSTQPNLPVPATYIIASDGSILYAFYDPDYTKRATVKQILENL